MATALSPWTTNPYLQAATGSKGVTTPGGTLFADRKTAGPPNPFSTVSNIKSPEVDDRLKSLFDLFDTTNKAGGTALTDYTAAVKKATPEVAGQTASDVAALGDLFNGQTSAELAGIRARRKAAMGQVVGRSLGDLRRLMGSTQIALGGGGRGLGTGSFLTRLGLDKSADIEARAAADDAAAERGDFEDVLNRRLAATGQRQRLTDTLAGRALLPFEAAGQRFNASSGMLGNLLQQQLLNSFYGLRGNPDELAT